MISDLFDGNYDNLQEGILSQVALRNYFIELLNSGVIKLTMLKPTEVRLEYRGINLSVKNKYNGYSMTSLHSGKTITRTFLKSENRGEYFINIKKDMEAFKQNRVE